MSIPSFVSEAFFYVDFPWGPNTSVQTAFTDEKGGIHQHLSTSSQTVHTQLSSDCSLQSKSCWRLWLKAVGTSRESLHNNIFLMEDWIQYFTIVTFNIFMRNVCRKVQHYVELFWPTTGLFSCLILWPKGLFHTRKFITGLRLHGTISWLMSCTVLDGLIQTCDYFRYCD